MRLIFLVSVVFLSIFQSVRAASFTYLGSKSVDELNYMLKQERKQFLDETKPSSNYRMPSAGIAKNAVDLYRVEYDSVIPEQDNRPIKVKGLVAIPKIAVPTALPIVSYQHGTVFGKNEVPSLSFDMSDPVNYDNSYESRLAVAQFGGNGYVVLATDYFGMSDSKEPEGYLVKASQQQACLDLYLVVKDWLLAEKNIQQNNLFLTGWSEGGFVTMAFLQKLEEKGIPVKAASTAAGFPDFLATFMGGIYHQRKIAAPWLSAGFSLAAWSYENYYKRPGLANDLFNPEYLAETKSLYERTYKADDLMNIIAHFSDCNVVKKEVKCALNMKKILADKYSDPTVFSNSEFAELARKSEVVSGYYKTQTRMYYGTMDEALSPTLATLAANYQKNIGNKAMVVAVPVANANHRATFITAISKQLPWFNGLM